MLVTFQMSVNDTESQWFSIVDIKTQDSNSQCTTLASYFRALAGGMQEAYTNVLANTVKATGSFAFSGVATQDQTCAILGVTFTARTSASTNVQYTIGANALASATNLAAKVNAYTGFTNVITATVTGTTNSAGITFTAVAPGLAGNFLPLSIGNLSNATLGGAFAGGTYGTSVIIDRS